MSDVKYVHICSDSGSITVLKKKPTEEPAENLYGWVVEVPKSFQITLDLSNIADRLYVYEWVLAHKDTRVIQQH